MDQFEATGRGWNFRFGESRWPFSGHLRQETQETGARQSSHDEWRDRPGREARPLLGGFSFVDSLAEFAECVGADQVVVDHADEQVFDGAAAEAVDDAADLLRGDVVGFDAGAIDVGQAFNVVLAVAFFLQPLQHRADRGVFQVLAARQSLAHVVCRDSTLRPHDLHGVVFECTQSGLIGFAVHYGPLVLHDIALQNVTVRRESQEPI